MSLVIGILLNWKLTVSTAFDIWRTYSMVNNTMGEIAPPATLSDLITQLMNISEQPLDGDVSQQRWL